MTDNEIIKALECCSKDNIKNCGTCPYAEKETNTYCVNDLIKDTLDLINRQKSEIEENNLKIDHQAQIIRTLETALADKMAEIERFKEKEKEAIEKLKEAMCLISETRDCVLNDIKKSKTKAIKEFAERVKEKYMFYGSIGKGELYQDIANLVKEMTVEKEREK